MEKAGIATSDLCPSLFQTQMKVVGKVLRARPSQADFDKRISGANV
jgi:hypothetical protein